MKRILTSFLVLSSVAFTVDISNLGRCVDEVKQSMAQADSVMLFTSDYDSLMVQLKNPAVKTSFPDVYQMGFVDPFISYLEQMGRQQFDSVFRSGTDSFLSQIIPDMAEAVLQIGSMFAKKATDAFQEVISDLYEGFLSEESRVSNETMMPIKPPDRGVIPPLVKWGNPDFGPYTWPVDATSELHLKNAVVSLPPAHLKGGLLAWTALPHETGGHDILHADTGLLEELGNKAYQAVFSKTRDSFLADYWRQCIDETASDVLGLLNTGPTTGVGLIGYFRGLGNGTLRNIGALPPADTHPIDILRAYMAASVVSKLSFSGAKEWSDAIRAEAKKDLGTLYLVDSRTGYYYPLSQKNALLSVEIVADVIMNTKMKSLENHSIKEIQDWTNDDQKMVDALALLMRQGKPLTADYMNSGCYAAHVVAAAVQEALKANTSVPVFFGRMIEFLDVMHQYNKIWTLEGTPGDDPASCTCTCACACCVRCQQGTAAHKAKIVHTTVHQELLRAE